MHDNESELFPLVDAEGHVVGKATRGHCHDGSRLLHPVVHLHVFRADGALYLQRRPAWKDVQPNRWDTAVGGHVDYGETPDEALRREVGEEIGLYDYQPHALGHYVFDSRRERELVYVYYTLTNAQPHPSAELDGGRFWHIDEIHQAIGQNLLTPNFEQEFLHLVEPQLPQIFAHSPKRLF